MKRPEVGQVWSIPFFPNQEDRTLGTGRWMFVVADYGDSVDVIALTSQLHQASEYNDTIIVRQNSDEGRLMNLEFDSLFIFDRRVNLAKTTFISPPCHYKGKCSEDFIDEYL